MNKDISDPDILQAKTNRWISNKIWIRRGETLHSLMWISMEIHWGQGQVKREKKRNTIVLCAAAWTEVATTICHATSVGKVTLEM